MLATHSLRPRPVSARRTRTPVLSNRNMEREAEIVLPGRVPSTHHPSTQIDRILSTPTTLTSSPQQEFNLPIIEFEFDKPDWNHKIVVIQNPDGSLQLGTPLKLPQPKHKSHRFIHGCFGCL